MTNRLRLNEASKNLWAIERLRWWGLAMNMRYWGKSDGMKLCNHIDHIKLHRLPEEVDGCDDCLASHQGWTHLRICLECGHVGCSDDSPGAHARNHAVLSGHPIVRSLEPDEEWCWCYIDSVGMLLPEVTGLTRIPTAPLVIERHRGG